MNDNLRIKNDDPRVVLGRYVDKSGVIHENYVETCNVNVTTPQPWLELIEEAETILEALKRDLLTGEMAKLSAQTKLMAVKGFLLNLGGEE